MKRADWIVFKKRLVHLVYRILGTLRFFPFTFAFDVLQATLKIIHLRTGRGHVRVTEIADHSPHLAREAMVWLQKGFGTDVTEQYDACFLLRGGAGGAEIQDLFAVLLTSPRLRSINFYWDEMGVADDLPMLTGKQERQDHVLAYESLSLSIKPAEFFRDDHTDLYLPVAAVRDAQTLLKRLVGADYAVCVNFSTRSDQVISALVRARPDVRFLDLNSPPLGGTGLTLHERMALVQAADAYVGDFDALGCAAVIGRRPTALWSRSGVAVAGEAQGRAPLLWMQEEAEAGPSTQAALQFLARHLPLGEAPGFRVAAKGVAGGAV